MAQHELWLTNDRGERIALLDDFTYFQGTKASNRVGQCRLYLPSTFDTSLLRIDSMIQLWRAPKGGRLSLWRPFLIQRIGYAMRGNEETIEVGGEDPNTLLRRRYVVASKGSAEADKWNQADDLMKAYVDEAMVNSTYTPVTSTGTRNYTEFTIQADLAAGPEMDHEAAFRNLYTTLQNIASKSRELGTDLFFDVATDLVTSSSITFQFRTYIGKMGADLSSQVVFDQAYGNFVNPFYERDWTNVQSFIYAAGQGPGVLRHIYETIDIARLYLSKWGWREGFQDARSADTEEEVYTAGFKALEKARPIQRFGGQPIDTDGTQYGVDWHYGDLVRARYRDIDVKCMVDAVTLTIEDAKETIETDLRVVSFGDTSSAQGGWIPVVIE